MYPKKFFLQGPGLANAINSSSTIINGYKNFFLQIELFSH